VINSADRHKIDVIERTRDISFVPVDVVDGLAWHGLELRLNDDEHMGRVKVEEGDPGDIWYVPVFANGMESLHNFRSLTEAREYVECDAVDVICLEPDPTYDRWEDMY
jgi:hypothetical protein